MTMPPNCGASQPGTQPSPFDWYVIAAVIAAGGVVFAVYEKGVGFLGIPIESVNGAAAVAGALAVVALVAYYWLTPDGCVRSPPKGEEICFGGIVETTVHNDDSTLKWVAPFAIPPLGYFDVVVKSMYWRFVTQNAFWVNCNSRGAALLRCVVENPDSCAARWGSMIGAAAAAIPGILAGIGLGALIAAACVATGPLALLCLLAALIVAALVAAAITYAGAWLGGLIGEAIGGPGNRASAEFPSLLVGTVVTVKGNWITEPDIGYNELLYTTFVGRNMMFPAPPSYTTEQADTTAADDCGSAVIL